MPRVSMGERRRRWPVLLILGLGLAMVPAEARVGGGQSFHSSGGGSSSGGGFHSSGGGYHSSGGGLHGSGGGTAGPGEILFVVGLILAAAVFQALQRRMAESDQTWSGAYGPQSTAPPARSAAVRTDRIRDLDANFSVPAFLDFATLLYQRVQRERTGPGIEALSPWIGEDLRRRLRASSSGVSAVSDVVVGAARIESVGRSAERLELVVRYESSLVEQRAEAQTALAVVERWTFSRASGVLSPAPEVLVAMRCPSCGSPGEVRADGTCTGCGTPIGGGRALWELSFTRRLSVEPFSAPELSLGGVEEGTRLPTVQSPTLGADLRELRGRDPAFELQAFLARVREIFLRLQAAWDAGDWSPTRPYQTDAQFQANRYWVERYRRFGLRNRLGEVSVERLVLVRLDRDAWYESATVRIWASMRDWTERADGTVVGGSRTARRSFSEYWTFLRTLERPASRKGDGLDACPSCGAPLADIQETGSCSYCQARISGGKFDWVLSRIEQDEVYGG